MKKFLAVLLAAVLSCSLLFAFAGCNKDAAENTSNADNSADASESDLAKIQEKGVLVVGMTEYKPMNYKEKGSDEWTGFDTEFAQAVAKELGVEVKFVEINWDNKFNELKSGSIDCIWNGMTITDEAKDAASISNPYAENAQVVVMKSSELSKYSDVESLKELSIAVEGGSAGEKAAAAAGLTNLVVSNTQALALTEVTSGAADACIIDLTMANSMTGEGTSNANLGFEIKLEAEEYGIAFRKDSDVTAKVNEIMAKLMNDGTLDKLAAKYEINLIK